MTQWPNAQRPMTNDQVRIFLAGGVALTDVTMLDKDDTVYLAWRGEAWREPGSKPASEVAAKEPAAVAAEGEASAAVASTAKAGADEATAREASPVEPASSRSQPSAEELLARRSRDAHRQRDAFRAAQRVHAAQHMPPFAAAQQHAAPRTRARTLYDDAHPHSRLRGREDGEGGEGTRHLP
jgi:hypothetical protein